MKRTTRWQWLALLTVTLIFSLACGLGGLGGRAEQAVEDAKEEAQAVVEEVSEEAEQAAQAVQEQAAEAAEQAQEAAEQAPEAVQEAAEQAQEAAEQAAETAQEAEEAATAGEAEEAELTVDSISQAVTGLDSYRAEFSMEFEGVDNQGQTDSGIITVLTEYIKEPQAMHMRMDMEGSTVADMGGSATMQFFNVGGTSYIQNPEDGSWVAFEDPDTGDSFAQGFFNPDDIIDLPDNARRDPQPQEVNGISTWHYTFSEEDFADPAFTFESANGEAWIAQEGNYPVKLIIEASGVNNAETSPDDFFQSGDFKMTYELKEINTDFTITVPEEALNATSLSDMFGGGEDGGMTTDPADIPFPLLDDAEVDFAMEGMVSYLTNQSMDDAVAFYRDQLAQQGWTNNPDAEFISEESSIMTFTKDGQELSLIISQEAEGQLSVIISTQ